jgi:hypothetical protein
MEDIVVLVTGFDRAGSWANIVFNGAHLIQRYLLGLQLLVIIALISAGELRAPFK